MSTGEEMSMRRPVLHIEERWIDRTQPHGVCKMLDSAIWFAKPQFDHAADRPARRQVRINQQRSVKEGSAIIKISDYICERVSGEAQYGRIVFAQFHSASREPPSPFYSP
jgi:hypothetical protein